MKRYLLFIFYLMLLNNFAIAGNIYTISPDNCGRQRTIQNAVDAASSGDIIELEDGTYTGIGNCKITINKDITIVSKSGNPKTCIIDANGKSNEFKPGFLISGGTVTIKNLTIKRGSASDAWPDCEGGGLCLRNGSAILDNLIFIECNSQLRGSAVSNESNNPLIVKNCIFENCGNGTNGGSSNSPVFGADGTGSLEINRCLVYKSSRIMGGITGTDDITITNCTFANLNVEWGGVMSNINEIKNTIVYKGGQNTYEGGVPEISYCLFTGNSGAWANPISSLLNSNGNMDEDPLFVDPDNDDYRLKENSPCIDAGDPNSPNDPDGTIADIGFHYYPQGTEKNNKNIKTISNKKLSCNISNKTLNLNNKFKENVNVKIYDIKGKVMSKYFLSSFGKHSINLSFLSNGVYCVKIENINTQVTKFFQIYN